MVSINRTPPRSTPPQTEQRKVQIEVEETGKIVINGVEYKITNLTVGNNKFIQNSKSRNLNLEQIEAIKKVLEETISSLIRNTESSEDAGVDFDTIDTINIKGKTQDFKVTTNSDPTPTSLQVTTETCTQLFTAFAQTFDGNSTPNTNPNTNSNQSSTSQSDPSLNSPLNGKITNLTLQKTRAKTSEPHNTSPKQEHSKQEHSKKVHPTEFHSPFSKRLWNMQLLKSNLFAPNGYRFKSGKLQETKNAINTLRAEILNLDKIKNDHKKCNELHTYLSTKLKEIEGWLDHREKTKKTVEHIFNINKSQLSTRLLAAEGELKITENFRNYAQHTLQGIRGQHDLDRSDLSDQLDQCLKYFSDRKLTYIKEGETGVEETTFNQLHNLLFPTQPLTKDHIVLHTDENDKSAAIPVSTSYSTGSHTVNVLSLAKNRHIIFDNLSLTPKIVSKIPKNIGTQTGSISVSENLLKELNLSECTQWQTPKWEKNNCYMSSALMRLTLFDYIRSHKPSMKVTELEDLL